MPKPNVIIITGALRGIGAKLTLSWPARHFCSNCMAVILHSGQRVYLLFLILGLVLGLA